MRWLPLIGSISLTVLVALISTVTIRELKEATAWRKHTFEVILEAQALEDGLIHSQSHIRSYAQKGNSNFLIQYKNDTNSEVQELKKLAELTSDNPAQQKRLQSLDTAMKAVFDNDSRIIGVYARNGPEAAMKLEEEGRGAVEEEVGRLEQIKAEEKHLLDKRDAAEQADFHRAARVLTIGSIAAAVMLVLSNYFVGREMAGRRRAEIKQRELIEELQKALSEVKTLSGLIPICGWCKKVRSDQGYWHTVEHYVSAHTDAKFSHGMCPECVEKWKAGLSRPKSSAG
ncbi:MAG TPA: CHASE3 domain-containing protein [Verrucomicrobiae bacterium]|nr:CHASE3 domain-containing protein [Verrucomicrobiae bacterium]